MPSQPATTLETFPNPAPERDYTIRMTIPEFTCLCPKTGQPDFATLDLEYVADARCRSESPALLPAGAGRQGRVACHAVAEGRLPPRAIPVAAR